MKSRNDYVAANRDAWSEAAPRHAAHNQQDLLEAVSGGTYSHFEPPMMAMLERIGVAGKSAVQLCCNNGIDLLSLKAMGAGDCVGVDQAEPFLEQARELAEASGFAGSTRFVMADVYDLPAEFAGAFDLVMTTIGVTGWMPDIEAFFRSAGALLKPGGHWVMEEMHPILMMYDEDKAGGPSGLSDSYFRTEPFEETTGLDYFGHERYDAKPNYSFTHRLADLVNAGLAAGLEVRHMAETPHNISNFCADLEHAKANPPLGLYMLWEKTAG